MKKNIKHILLTLVLIAAAVSGADARKINVHGIVTSNYNSEPINGVCIFDAANHHLLGATNDEGKYLISIDDAAVIEFCILGHQNQTIPVNGRLNIDVELEREALALSEIVVEGKQRNNVILAEPTDIDVVGNYLHIKTRVKMPHKMFNTSTRLLIQPMVYNVTKKEINYMQPIVFDGWRYNTTQERMYDFDRKKDPLSDYVQIKQTSSRADNIIFINDSIYVENPKDDFRCDVMLSLEDYNHILYGDTTTIARGVVNPLRFLDLKASGTFVTDNDYLPMPDLQLRDTRGDVNLTFNVNKTRLDLDLGNNRAEMNGLLSKIHEIERDPNSTLKSFSISGTASPEGNYEHNLTLATKRLQSALDFIYQNIDESTRRNATFESQAGVENWSTVVGMLRADGLTAEASAVENVLSRFPNNNLRQSYAISRLSCYDKIRDTYLPQLRRVSYKFVSSQYRYLTDEEIAELYRTDSSKLTRYEFWRLYTIADTPEEKETIARRALEVHPNFLVAANDLTALLIQKGEPTSEFLAPLVQNAGNRVPNEARATLAAAYLNENNFQAADSLAEMLPDEPRFHQTIVYAKALNGKYLEVMQELANESPFNEVLLLLAIKADDEAWEKAKLLGDSAKEEYVKAICANRLDYYIEATDHLEKALRLDPELRQIAKVDGDVMSLLDDDNQNEDEKE